MTRAERQINWNLRDLLCDKCLAMVEADEETPIAEYCTKCKTKLVDWSIDVLGDRAPDLLRCLEAHDAAEEDD